MSLFDRTPLAYLLLNDKGLPVAGRDLSLDDVGPFIERLHDAFDRGETDYAVWSEGGVRFLGASVGTGVVIVRCGDEVPLTKVLYLLEDIRTRCRAMLS